MFKVNYKLLYLNNFFSEWCLQSKPEIFSVHACSHIFFARSLIYKGSFLTLNCFQSHSSAFLKSSTERNVDSRQEAREIDVRSQARSVIKHLRRIIWGWVSISVNKLAWKYCIPCTWNENVTAVTDLHPKWRKKAVSSYFLSDQSR